MQYSPSFPATGGTAENGPRPSWRLRIRALAISLAVPSMLTVDSANSTEMTPPMTHDAATASSVRFEEFIAEASQRFGVPTSWIRAVMLVESIGDAHALSPKGAMGLMQIMPETWAALRSRYGLGANPYDPHDNILAGTAYLRELHDRYGVPGFLAAYNAGPVRYEEYLTTDRPLPGETRAYVVALAPLIGGGTVDGAIIVATTTRSWTDAPLFVVGAESRSTETRPSSDPQSGRISIAGTVQDFTALARRSDGLFVRLSGRNSKP